MTPALPPQPAPGARVVKRAASAVFVRRMCADGSVGERCLSSAGAGALGQREHVCLYRELRSQDKCRHRSAPGTGRGGRLPCAEYEARLLRAQERSKRQVVAAGGGLADAELELMWNWNIHTRRHPIHANSQARAPAAPRTRLSPGASRRRRSTSASAGRICVTMLLVGVQVPAACEGFARAHAVLLAARPALRVAFATHLLLLSDAGLLPHERLLACLALVPGPGAPA